MTEDKRYVYCTFCTWHGPIQEVRSGYIPGCKFCGAPLFEHDSKEVWDSQADKFMKVHPEFSRYKEWLEFLRENPVPLRNWDWKSSYKEWEEEQNAKR